MTDDPKLQMARRAAASVWAKQGDQEFADRIMAGNDDFCEEVQAALAAIEECTEAQSARIEELEAALEWAMSYARNQSTDEEGLARAESALSSAIGEQHEFSGWVEVVEEDRA